MKRREAFKQEMNKLHKGIKKNPNIWKKLIVPAKKVRKIQPNCWRKYINLLKKPEQKHKRTIE